MSEISLALKETEKTYFFCVEFIELGLAVVSPP